MLPSAFAKAYFALSVGEGKIPSAKRVNTTQNMDVMFWGKRRFDVAVPFSGFMPLTFANLIRYLSFRKSVRNTMNSEVNSLETSANGCSHFLSSGLLRDYTWITSPWFSDHHELHHHCLLPTLDAFSAILLCNWERGLPISTRAMSGLVSGCHIQADWFIGGPSLLNTQYRGKSW